jgi:DNA-binding transcriptional MerR regulator
MRIGELARSTGVSARSLRHYEAAGLLAPARSTSGYRDYDQAEVITVGIIKTLIAAGLPLGVISQVLPSVPACGGFAPPSEHLVAQLEAITEELRAKREEMSRAILVLTGVTARSR